MRRRLLIESNAVCVLRLRDKVWEAYQWYTLNPKRWRWIAAIYSRKG